MFSESKKHKGLFCESDQGLAAKFREAGFGVDGESGGVFHPLEAGYLVKAGKSSFAGRTLAVFVSSQKKADKIFPFALAAFSLIRATGRQARPFMAGMKYFRVYAPGVGREEERPSQLVCLLPGKAPSAKSLSEEVKVAHLARLDLIAACGTEEEIKFYKISSYNF
jgi:hypothetical protein